MDSIPPILIFLLIGAVAGWLAGVLMRGGGFGLAGDIVIGIAGAILFGQFISPLVPIGGLLGEIIVATLGACLLIFIIRLIKRA